MKKIIFGVVIGILLSSTVVYGATAIKSAYFNENIKLSVNGVQAPASIVTVEVDGEKYGRNYVSVADFIKALNDNGQAFTYSFDSKTQSINVSTGQAKIMKSSAAVEETKQTPDGIQCISYPDGWYVSASGIEHKYKTNSVYYELSPIPIKGSDSSQFALLKKITITYEKQTVKAGTLVKELAPIERTSTETILENIPLRQDTGNIVVSYDYYVSTIMPLLSNLK